MSAFASLIPVRARGHAIFDVRAGEARSVVVGPALLLLLIITAHTVLETARDALLLTGPGPQTLGAAYMLIAACTLPASALAVRASERFGPRRALAATIVIGIILPAVMFPVVRRTPLAAVAAYVVSGVLGSVVVPQFWTFLGTRVTVAQGRRLFGVISTGGTVGGVLGPALAGGALVFVSLRSLLLVSASVFVLAGVTLALLPRSERHPPTPRHTPSAPSLSVLRGRPFVTRLALVVCLSTATFLTLDYLFKSSIARALPPPEIGRFVARYYLALNLVSLVVQFFASGPMVRALGIAGALVVTPLLLAFGAAGALAAGGALAAVLVVKGIDGGLRYSVHRVTEELAYLPIPAAVRLRAKPFIDGALVRLTQTLVGAALWWGRPLASPRVLAAAVAILAIAWLVTVLSARRPYLALLRLAVSKGALNVRDTPEPLDLETAELLVQRLGSPDPLEVIGAMSAIARRDRLGLVPALVLLHGDEAVLTQALEIFGGSRRSDWYPLAQRLLDDARESVRVAAGRALARHDQLTPESLDRGGGAHARGYTAVRFALRDGVDDATVHPRVAELLAVPREEGAAFRLGMLAAIADAPRTRSLPSLLLELAKEPPASADAPRLLARAAARQRELRMIPCLINLLAIREGREEVRDALASFGEQALGEVSRALYDGARPRGLRLHVPKALARFGSRRAAACLLENIESERDGGIRYRSIRALASMASGGTTVARSRVERICRTDLERYFRLLGRRDDLLRLRPPEEEPSIAVRLLSGLLEDKVRQALDRACLLLEIAHPGERLHGVFLACVSEKREPRAAAAEFLDTLLRRSHEELLRNMLHLVADDLSPEERAGRARALGWCDRAASLDEMLSSLIEDPDVTVAALAMVLARDLGGPALSQRVERARLARPEIEASALRPSSSHQAGRAVGHA